MPFRHTIHALLFQQRDASKLVLFRMAFGLLMGLETLKYILAGWVQSQYLQPQLLFKYYGFSWVGLLPAPLLYAVFVGTALAAFSLAAGFYYRSSCVLFTLGHSYIFLVASSYYLNHAYLISLLGLTMAFLPANRMLAVDSWRNSDLHCNTVPRWSYFLPCAMLAIVYSYGAIAKLNPDWLAGEPMRHWLNNSARDVPFFKSFIAGKTALWLTVYGGIAFDAFAIPALIFRPTRPLAIVLSVAFHCSNAYLFHIGIFPWLMLAATTLYFEPNWPHLLPYGYGEAWQQLLQQFTPKGQPTPGPHLPTPPPSPGDAWTTSQRRVLVLLTLWLGIQLLLPLRHHLYPNHVAWTDQGHYFSWRMKLRQKLGHLKLRLVANQGKKHWTVDPATQLSKRQLRKVIGKPDLLLQYVAYLKRSYAKTHGDDLAIYADVFVSLNYRPARRFVDPKVDLGKDRMRLSNYAWILPFNGSPITPKTKRLRAGAFRIPLPPSL